MVEVGSTVAGVAGGDSSSATARVASSCVKIRDRTKFTVELRPGETTIVSWKKLMKDAAKAEGDRGGGSSVTASAPNDVAAAAVAASEVPGAAHPGLEARLAPGEPAANEDAQAPNRFSAVIEKIERLYTGKDSDEEDLGDVPDDDQYDTDDSFIDDTDLNDYFEVDKSKTKHDGYFVNRGTLEKISEPMESANQQPKKKRRRKDAANTAGTNDDGERPIKHLKAGRKGAGKSALSAEKGMLPLSEVPTGKSSEEIKLQHNQKTGTDGKSLLPPSKMALGDGSLNLLENNNKTAIFPAKNSSSKLKDASGSGDRSESIHKSHSVKKDPGESQIAIQQKDKAAMRERIDLNLPDTKHSMQPLKVNKKEGSSAKPKANVLEKAIRELEKIVAESRPPAADALDGDSSSQCVKRRLPRDIKQKLAKVARLSYASNGKLSQELLTRLMGILGHLIQLRTLKRHLKIMATTSLSAKQEKDDRFQQLKKEVVDILKVDVPPLIPKAAEQHSGGSGELHDSSQSEKGAKGKLCIDAILEDKICDLYDLFVDGLDEDAAPQVRKLYAELAELWPKGVMDNHGIKRAICRSKERKRTVNEKNKDQEKIKRKKVVATRIEETVRIEPNPATQSQYMDMRLATDPSSAVVSHQNRFSTSTTYAAATAITPMNSAPSFTPSTNVPSFERPKLEKVKGTQNSSLTDGRTVDSVIVKKKVKKRAESLPGDAHMRSEKLASHQGNDKHKQHTYAAPPQSAPHKSNFDDFRFEPLT